MRTTEQRAKGKGQRATYPTKIAIFLITLSGLILEVGLTRIYSASIWYHFAFVATSAALLGRAVAGSLYFADLLGAAIGAVLVTLLLNAVGGEAALLAGAIAPGIAAVLMTGIRGKGVGDSGERSEVSGLRSETDESSLSPASR